MSINNPQLQLTRGTVVHGQFRIERELGRGAMGVVYLATQLNLDRSVALKVFSIEDADVKDPDKLFNEARAAGALSHVNIVQVYSAGRADSGIGFFAMEYVAGETLGETIKREKQLEVEKALQLAQEVAGALKHGWRRLNLTHGDIKPDNVMLTQDGMAKLADFGLARAAIYDSDEDDLRLTPLYAAPEMITGEWRSGDCRADMYSFGATLYHMLVGQPPFPGDNPQDVMHRQVHDRPVPLAVRKPGIPPALSEFVDKLLAKSPADRPESWAAIVEKVAKLRSSPQGESQPHPHAHSGSPPPVKFSRHADRRHLSGKRSGRNSGRKSVPMVFSILLLLVVVLGLAVLVANRSNRSRRPTAVRQRVSRQAAAPALPRQTKQEDPETRGNHEATPLPESRDDELDAARVLAEERQMAPTSEKRTQSLPGELKKVEKDSETPAAKLDPNREGEQEHRPADEAVDLEVRELLAAEAYTELMARIVGLQWNPGTAVPAPLHAGINEWIEAHGAEGAPSAKVQFLKNRVLPSAKDFIHRLVLRHAQLTNKSLPGEKFKGQSISRVTREGVEMARELPFGKATTMYNWSVLCSDVDQMIYLGNAAFADKDLPITELRPYLATLFLTGRTKQLVKRLRALPESRETSLWTALAEDYEGLMVEKRAAALWRQARDASALDNPRSALRALEQLRSLDARFNKTHAEKIEQLEKRSYQASPQSTVASKTEEILKLVNEQPFEVLVKAAALFANFGSLDYPEKPDAIAARQQALRAIVKAPHHQALLSRSNESLGRLGKYCLKRLIQLKKTEHSSSSTVDGLLHEGFRAGILLDVGDWMGSVQIFPFSLVAKQSKNIKPADRLRLGYIAVRLANRYSLTGPSGAVDLSLFEDVAKAMQDDENAAVEAINHAFVLGLECGIHSFHNWKTGRRPPDVKPWAYWKASRQKQFLLQFAWMSIHGYQSEAEKMTGPIIQWANAAEELPGGPFVPMLRRLYSSLTDEKSLDLARMPQDNHFLTAPFWRAALSEILARAPQTIWDYDLPTVERMTTISGTGPLQASLWSDLAVLKLARLMADGDMGAAAEMAVVLKQNLPRQALPFRTELRFYRAGIELLRGRRAAASDLLQKITRSGLAASDERELAEFWCRQLSGEKARFSPAGKSRRAVYYHLWLKAADEQSEQTRFSRVRALKLMAERAPTPARIAFCRKLTTLFNNN